jgi:uncharacterized membrane protein YeaQ/YmgE (transglycosylase-associated protein family)
MILSVVLYGFLFATLLAALFHLWRDGGLGKLIIYLLASWTGFWLGQLAANKLNLHMMDLGELHLGPALLGSIIFLFLGHWFSRLESQRERFRPGR